jgi:hypothetical protein
MSGLSKQLFSDPYFLLRFSTNGFSRGAFPEWFKAASGSIELSPKIPLRAFPDQS